MLCRLVGLLSSSLREKSGTLFIYHTWDFMRSEIGGFQEYPGLNTLGTNIEGFQVHNSQAQLLTCLFSSPASDPAHVGIRS